MEREREWEFVGDKDKDNERDNRKSRELDKKRGLETREKKA